MPSSHYLKPVGTLYKGDVYLPVFSWKREPYRWIEIVKSLLGSYEPDCLCRDIVCDKMGAWKHNGSPLKRFDVDKSTRSLTLSAPGYFCLIMPRGDT